jgi:starch-binding outer membrane protein, SusD/RagB family
MRYYELWDYEQPNGANEKVSEVILAAQFSNDESTWGRYGNQMHLYYPARSRSLFIHSTALS